MGFKNIEALIFSVKFVVFQRSLHHKWISDSGMVENPLLHSPSKLQDLTTATLNRVISTYFGGISGIPSTIMEDVHCKMETTLVWIVLLNIKKRATFYYFSPPGSKHIPKP